MKTVTELRRGLCANRMAVLAERYINHIMLRRLARIGPLGRGFRILLYDWPNCPAFWTAQ